MNKQTLITVVGVIVAVVASVFLGGTTTIRQIETQMGAVASPVIQSPFISVGGLETWSANVGMYQASTTQCAIQSPSSTSTLTYAAVRFDVSSTTAMTTSLYKSATAFAQTTQLGVSVATAANGQNFILASTTAAQQAAGANVFAPNSWLVVYSTGGTGTYSPVGSCSAQFIRS